MHSWRMAAGLVLAGTLALSACNGEHGDPNGDDSSNGGEAGAANELVPCLDRPGELSQPPDGRLPCDLLPPGFGD